MDALSLRRQAIDDSALRPLVDEVAGLAAADYSAATWSGFAAARDSATTVLGALSTQAQIDAAAASLQAAREALASALRSVTVAPASALLVPVGAAFDAASVVITASFADADLRRRRRRDPR